METRIPVTLYYLKQINLPTGIKFYRVADKNEWKSYPKSALGCLKYRTTQAYPSLEGMHMMLEGIIPSVRRGQFVNPTKLLKQHLLVCKQRRMAEGEK